MCPPFVQNPRSTVDSSCKRGWWQAIIAITVWMIWIWGIREARISPSVTIVHRIIRTPDTVVSVDQLQITLPRIISKCLLCFVKAETRSIPRSIPLSTIHRRVLACAIKPTARSILWQKSSPLNKIRTSLMSKPLTPNLTHRTASRRKQRSLKVVRLTMTQKISGATPPNSSNKMTKRAKVSSNREAVTSSTI